MLRWMSYALNLAVNHHLFPFRNQKNGEKQRDEIGAIHLEHHGMAVISFLLLSIEIVP